jgi:hypothetical protein
MFATLKQVQGNLADLWPKANELDHIIIKGLFKTN